MGKKTKQWVACMMVFLLVALVPMAALAADGAPQQVLDSRNGVVRIVVTMAEGWGTGSGFVVGTEDEYYVVTNYHVIDGAQSVYVMYDTNKYTKAKVVSASPWRDIAILKTDKAIPDVKIMPLETGTIDTGMNVYLLGYSGASDQLAQGDEVQYSSETDLLKNIIADKQSMTITNGIVSAVINSALVGPYPIPGYTAKLLQTNVAINRGNSGGPLVDSEGNVVGINTLGLSGYEWHIEAMNGSVHVDELLRELRNAGIEFEVTAPTSTAPAAPEKGNALSGGAVAGIAAGAVVALGLLVAALVVAGRASKKDKEQGATLYSFERTGQPVAPPLAADMVKGLLRQLVPLAATQDVNELLRPDNLLIEGGQLRLASQKPAASKVANLQIYPGYSAPESYRNRADGRTAVYFVGAVLAALMSGRRPEDALTRAEKPGPLTPGQSAVQQVANAATQLEEQNRIQTLQQLLAALETAGQPPLPYPNAPVRMQGAYPPNQNPTYY